MRKKDNGGNFRRICDALIDTMNVFIRDGGVSYEELVGAFHVMHQKLEFTMRTQMFKQDQENSVQGKVASTLKEKAK